MVNLTTGKFLIASLIAITLLSVIMTTYLLIVMLTALTSQELMYSIDVLVKLERFLD